MRFARIFCPGFEMRKHRLERRVQRRQLRNGGRKDFGSHLRHHLHLNKFRALAEMLQFKIWTKEATTVVLHVFIVHPVKCFKQLLDELDTKSFRALS